MKTNQWQSAADELLSGRKIDPGLYRAIARLPENEVPDLLPAAERIREHYFGNEIHLCTICNGKSGLCTENCSFCSQSRHSSTDAPVYPLLSRSTLREGGLRAAATPINRYSIVTTGRGLPDKEVAAVAEALGDLREEPVSTCASLGILGEDALRGLKAAGVTRYHHNLETSRSHFPSICNTHTYEARIRTLKAARKAGLSLCCGGVFGIGETDEQVLELALDLKELDVDAVPVNFLVPIEGTPLAGKRGPSALRCLKIISLFRFVMPDKDIFICGGREDNLKKSHPLIFEAGASGIMTGNYLTTEGRQLDDDLALLDRLGLVPRPKA